jgi:hypothetical protein
MCDVKRRSCTAYVFGSRLFALVSIAHGLYGVNYVIHIIPYGLLLENRFLFTKFKIYNLFN